MPTGYFKVIYRPAAGEQPAQAIGFLLPHSYERLEMLADHYDGLGREEAYWGFVSRIEVIEEFSGIRFPGISEELKHQWRSSWFFERRGVRTIRSGDCGDGTPAGILIGAPRDERRAVCRPIPAEPD